MRTATPHAQAATAIRQELKSAFPNTKFSVRSRSFSMGDAVDVEWVDGPTNEQVQHLINKYQEGHFDGMDDMYHNSNIRDDIPQVKYVQVRHKLSDTNRKEWLGKFNRVYQTNYTMDDVNGSTWDNNQSCWTSVALERFIKDHESPV